MSVDLRPLTKMPLGFLLSYIADSFSSGSNDVGSRAQTFGFGISYTGRREFDIGLETIGQRLGQKASNTAVVIAVFRLKMRSTRLRDSANCVEDGSLSSSQVANDDILHVS